ncbi:molybdopterin-synthase adenylyltransferase MoeB [Sphingorhabdus soli]|uniref:Molybdopterin-synthase adenylyltransferase n=1 Tax=Flavisphingopyxis soli TaxID=2601267 RepID=A0A5C6U9L6_9SPHN|nr:molybdopterin-synthase adenylyltransferase MoeB [Sphingorhabdus soli]TXC68335.1 molybdopterin-synthase adenylyltransferase MoeB [Sphingorhabdus soli]
MPLSDDELDRYARQIVLKEIGGAGQVALTSAHVVVIGAGGIGGPVLLYLAAAGIGRLTVIDDDAISLSNLQRQILFDSAEVGAPKVDGAAKAIARINPGVSFMPVETRVTRDNVDALLAGADVVVDGSDNFATRLVVSDATVRLEIPLVSAAIGQFQGQIGTFSGWREGAPCYRCFVGDAHDADDCDSCSEVGVLGALCGMMGSWAAMEAIRVIVPFGEDQTGKLHIFDGLTPMMRTMRIPKDADCRACGTPK